MSDIEAFEFDLGLPKEAWYGNIPARKVGRHIDGGRFDEWTVKWGSGWTYKDKIYNFSFRIPLGKETSVEIVIVRDTLVIMKNRYGSLNVEYYSNDKTNLVPVKWQKPMEDPEKYLNIRIDNCKIWHTIQKRAKELYEQSKAR